nr:hypothetical protein BaRGS_009887 [Batillaria attramentaria]
MFPWPLGCSNSIMAGHKVSFMQRPKDRGMSDEEIDDVLFSVGARLLHMTSFSKRISGWKRIPIQTRFAPFGTKLVPSRTYGDSSGSTLLRYGRSVAQ